MSTLAIGTAQFGLQYGVANAVGRVPSSAIDAILRRAREAGIDTLDTAIAYGESEASLGKAGVSSWRLITKLPAMPNEITDVPSWVETQVLGSLQRLGVGQLEALLLHKPADLLGPAAEGYIRTLERLRSRGYFRAVGISIYDPAELEAICKSWRPDIVQAPFNVLDRRLVSSGWLANLTRDGVRVHVRSVFLQGLLMMPAARRPAWFKRWSALLDRWLNWCQQHDILPLQAALAFVRAQPGIERVVVGVDSMVQLEEILTASAVDAPLPPENIFSGDRDLIEPSRWKLT